MVKVTIKASKTNKAVAVLTLLLVVLSLGRAVLTTTNRMRPVVPPPRSSSEDGHHSTTTVQASEDAPQINVDGQTTLYTYKLNDPDTKYLGCSLTVALIDPRFPYFQSNDTMFTKTLESVADYVPKTACIVLQTSICLLQQLHQQLQQQGNCHSTSSDIREEKLLYYHGDVRSSKDSDGYYLHDSGTGSILRLSNASHSYAAATSRARNNCTSANNRDSESATSRLLRLAAEQIRSRSGPLLRDFWNRGRVRVSVLNHSLYGLQSCQTFSSVNNVLLSKRYWMNEFVRDQDADKVLVMQRDGVLCKALTARWRNDFDYVASPWFVKFPYVETQFVRGKYLRIRRDHQSDDHYSKEKWMKYWTLYSNSYTGHYYTAQKHTTSSSISNCSTMAAQVNNLDCPLPPGIPIFPKSLPNLHRWVGNGGLSLRSRTAMIRMLRLCPKRKSSDQGDVGICQVDAMQEDIFFSAMLTLTGGGTIAGAAQAAFFATDQDFGWPVLEDPELSKLPGAPGDKGNTENGTRSSSNTKQPNLDQWLGLTAWKKLQEEKKNLGHYLPVGQHKCFHSFKSGGYACERNKKYCKYSFNDDDRPITMFFENGW